MDSAAHISACLADRVAGGAERVADFVDGRADVLADAAAHPLPVLLVVVRLRCDARRHKDQGGRERRRQSPFALRAHHRRSLAI